MRFPRSARWLGCLLLLATALAGDSKDAAGPPRVLHMDLHSLGAVGLEIAGPYDPHVAIPPDTPASVIFLDNSTLAVSFPIYNSRTVLSTRTSPQGGSHLSHTAVLDVATAHVKVETTWGTAFIHDKVLAAMEGRLLVRSNDKLALFSAEGKEERSYRFRDPAKTATFVSPSGKTLFVVMKTAEHQERVEVLDSATLTSLHSLTIESIGLDAGSDSFYAYLLPGKKGYALFVLPFGVLGERSPPALQPLYFTQQDGCKDPYFVADDLLVLGGYCDTVTLLAADGTPKLARPLGSTAYLDAVTPSRNQRRFAVGISGGVLPLKTEGGPDPIRVYEVDGLAPISDVELGPGSVEHIPILDFALSPDGSLLAVLDGFDLSVYELPRPLVVPMSAGSGVQVSASTLSDLGHEATGTWVRISNHGTTDIALDPRKATLQILGPKRKTLRARNPDKVAGDIRYVGLVDANSRDNECNAGVCGDSTLIKRKADENAAQVRQSALRPQTLKPGQQVQGTIYFAYQRKRGEAVLRIPVGDKVFEFPVPAPSK